MRISCASITLFAVMLSGGVIAVEPAAAQTAPSASMSTPPTLLRLEGQLTTPAGQPRTGSVLLVVSLYAQQTDSTPLWTEQQLVTLDQTGRYVVLAGATQADGLPQQFFLSGQARWIGVGVQGEAEQPRIGFVNAPYALKAREADTLAGKAASDFVLATNLSSTVKSAVTEAAAATVNVLPTTVNRLSKFTDTAAGVGDSAVVEVNGNVGIGTTGPGTALEVSSPNAATAYFSKADVSDWTPAQIQLRGSNGNSIPVSGIQSNGEIYGAGRYWNANFTVDGKVQTGMIRFASSANESGGAVGQNIQFLLGSDGSGALAEKMRITNSGNLGIGTPNPSTKLHVVGDVTVTGNIGAKYQDVAEWVETAAPLEPGTVVIVDPLKPNRVLPTSRAYDTRVAGAVSQQPGLLLGERSDTKAMVAQSGRVRIKADARYGAIKIGDLLVTSPTRGYAMRSRPVRVGNQVIHRSGTLLGKALEALPSGKGEILVLLTLQ